MTDFRSAENARLDYAAFSGSEAELSRLKSAVSRTADACTDETTTHRLRELIGED